MDVNSVDVYLDGLCVGCLSTGRRLEPLAGAARELFNQIIGDEVYDSSDSERMSVCWECVGGVRSALRMRRRALLAADTLRTRQKYLYEASLQKPGGNFHATCKFPLQIQSLSGLSCHINKDTLLISHVEKIGWEAQDRATDTEDLIIKQENNNDDMGDVDGFFTEETEQTDGHNEVDIELQAAIKLDILKHETILQEKKGKKEDSMIKNKSSNKKKKKRQKQQDEEFDESDDEPLTLKKLKQDHKKPRGRRKKLNTEAGGGGGGDGGRVYREQAAGVVRGERVAARLRALGVPPGHVDMVVLSWEQVEAERQRALCSEQYTRHSHRCERCAVGFNQRCKLLQHLTKHDPSSGALECSACHIRCRAPHALAAHRRRHRVRWRCALCGSLWSRAAVAADHAARAHGLPRPPAHACPTCAHVAPSLGKLRTHLKEHAARVRCHQCGKSLRDKASLNTHLLIHSGVKEHVCPEARCGKRFVFKKAMELHADTHRPHQHLYCHTCDMTFKNQTTFYHHKKYSLKHVDPDALKFGCAACGARFLSARRLGEHRAARHLHTKPVACQLPGCHFACASRASLRAHVAGVHRGQRARRNHVCHACGKAYTTKKTLEGHLRSHSGERPFRCDECGATFGYHAALYNHTRLVHHKHKSKRARDPPAPPPALRCPSEPYSAPPHPAPGDQLLLRSHDASDAPGWPGGPARTDDVT